MFVVLSALFIVLISDVSSGFSECDTQGDCDLAMCRNAYLADPNVALDVVRIRYTVLCEDDGNNCVTTVELIEEQVALVNSVFGDYGFHFTLTGVSFVSDTDLRNTEPQRTNDFLYKQPLLVSPQTTLNVMVGDWGTGGTGYATTPWEPNAKGSDNGICLNFPQVSGTKYLIVHEIGHVLGLRHTYYRTELCAPEFQSCNDYPGAPAQNRRGDWCADTPPAPVPPSSGNGCQNPGGTDTCEGQSWGNIDFANFMDKPGNACWASQGSFSAQQTARMRCWVAHELESWLLLCSELPEDLNVDGIVDLTDLSAVLANFNQPGPIGDVNSDGIVDISDLAAVLQAMGSRCTISLDGNLCDS